MGDGKKEEEKGRKEPKRREKEGKGKEGERGGEEEEARKKHWAHEPSGREVVGGTMHHACLCACVSARLCACVCKSLCVRLHVCSCVCLHAALSCGGVRRSSVEWSKEGRIGWDSDHVGRVLPAGVLVYG